ncbi:MAG: hypothetical protein AAF449_11405, partial [Myxococcota bacterium]
MVLISPPMLAHLRSETISRADAPRAITPSRLRWIGCLARTIGMLCVFLPFRVHAQEAIDAGPR